MAVNYTNLFTKLGYIGGLLNSINTYRGTTIPGKVATLYTEYTSTSDEGTIDGTLSDVSGWQSSAGSLNTTLKQLASQTIVNTVNADVLQPDQSISTALVFLAADMKANSQTVKASSVAISGAAGGSNDGNPVFVYSTKTSDGLTLENLFAETMTGTCTIDSQSGGVKSGSEVVTFAGQTAQSDSLNWSYPQGSGSTTTLTVVDAGLDEPGGNSQWLLNGDFENWTTTTNVPDGFHLTVGTAGTNTIKASSAYTGSFSLGMVGDGATLTALEQQFGVDNINLIQPLTQYAFILWLKASVVPAAGVLEIALVDGSGTVIQDAQGVNNVVTKTLSAASTSFVALNGVFRTPRLLPFAVYLRIRFSTACSSGTTIYVDRLSFTQMVQTYLGGPYISGFSGNLELIKGDSFTVTTTNTPGGFQQLFDKFFGMKGLKLLLPSSGSPTQLDSLIN